MKSALIVILAMAVILYVLLPTAPGEAQRNLSVDPAARQAGFIDSVAQAPGPLAGMGQEGVDVQAVISETLVYLPFVPRSFVAGSNQAPYMPASPVPADGAAGVDVDVTLSWIGGDPDGDAVAYDVYLEADDDTPGVPVCEAVTGTLCEPGPLAYGTEYYWQVIATDEHAASTVGAVWAFTTTVTAPLLEEDFQDGWEEWTEFLNDWRLAPGQWYWDATGGYGGSAGLTHDAYAVPLKEAAHALVMWLQPGAEEWADYRAETRILLRTDNEPHGLWVRGQYQDAGGSDPGGWVTGYYVLVGGAISETTHLASLQQLQTVTDCWGPACYNPEQLYDFATAHELTATAKTGALERDRWYTLTVEVRGDQIKVWLDGVLYIDYVDVKEPFLSGTVGFKTYKANSVTFDDVVVTPIE